MSCVHPHSKLDMHTHISELCRSFLYTAYHCITNQREIFYSTIYLRASKVLLSSFAHSAKWSSSQTGLQLRLHICTVHRTFFPCFVLSFHVIIRTNKVAPVVFSLDSADMLLTLSSCPTVSMTEFFQPC